jgi:hypothetical protein
MQPRRAFELGIVHAPERAKIPWTLAIMHITRK